MPERTVQQPRSFPEKPAPVDYDVLEAIRRRWSPRAIDPQQPVSDQDLHRLLEAARWAPSCFNEQPWRILLFDESTPKQLEEARASLTPGNAWAKAAPLLMLTVAKPNFSKNDKPNRVAEHDVGIAAGFMALQAIDLGLVFHQMAGFDTDQARQAFGIPDGHLPMAMIAVGHPGRVEDLPENKRDAEKAPRRRTPHDAWTYRGSWNQSL